jgi:hypothetical protein
MYEKHIKNIIISTVLASVVMYTLSFFWHGIVLNDLSRLNYPKEVFFLFAAFIYVVVSFFISSMMVLVDFGKKNHIKGILIGVPTGIFIYLIAFTFGISFYATPQIFYVLVDVAWQAVEQGIGGAVVGLVFMLSKKFKKANVLVD